MSTYNDPGVVLAPCACCGGEVALKSDGPTKALEWLRLDNLKLQAGDSIFRYLCCMSCGAYDYKTGYKIGWTHGIGFDKVVKLEE